MGEDENTRSVPRLPEGPRGPRKGATSRISIGEIENAAGFASVQMEAFSEAWQATLGKPVSLTSPEASRQSAADLASALAGRTMLARLVFAGARPGESYLFLPEVDALIMAGFVSMLSEAEIATKAKGALTDEDLSALSEALSHAAARASAALSAEFGEEFSLSVGDIFVMESPGETEVESLLGPEPLSVAFALQLSEFETSHALVAYGEDLAASFKPREMKITDTQILPVPGAGRGRSLVEELGLEGASGSGEPGAEAPGPREPVDIERVMRVRLAVSVRIAEKPMTVGEILELSPGSVVQLGVRASSPLGLYANNHRIAEGSVVVKGEHFALQLTNVTSQSARVLSMT